jgi:hypothetical protein
MSNAVTKLLARASVPRMPGTLVNAALPHGALR